MTTDDTRAVFERLAHSPGIRTAQEYADSLSERPEPPMQIGDRVAWTIDGRHNRRAERFGHCDPLAGDGCGMVFIRERRH